MKETKTESEKGSQNKLGRKKGRHWNINKHAFFRGKTAFLKHKKDTNQKNEGLGPSEVALRATSPDP